MSRQRWDTVITSERTLFEVPLSELWRYRDLVRMLVKRDFVTFYKQTILGPIWFVLQPLLTTLMYSLIFGRIAGLSTDGLPQILFYLSGVTLWNYFADNMLKTSTTFSDNQQLFGKVYFPRLVTPISTVLSNGLKFIVQYFLFIAFVIIYSFQIPSLVFRLEMLLVPLVVLLTGLISMGIGMVITSLTTKYRDLKFLLQFGVQLLMFATPVIYPLSSIPEDYSCVFLLNPIAPLAEAFRYAHLGVGTYSMSGLVYSAGFGLVIMVIGTLVFNRTEKNFIDTI